MIRSRKAGVEDIPLIRDLAEKTFLSGHTFDGSTVLDV